MIWVWPLKRYCEVCEVCRFISLPGNLSQGTSKLCTVCSAGVFTIWVAHEDDEKKISLCYRDEYSHLSLLENALEERIKDFHTSNCAWRCVPQVLWWCNACWMIFSGMTFVQRACIWHKFLIVFVVWLQSWENLDTSGSFSSKTYKHTEAEHKNYPHHAHD